jgi:WD40 repeat protein
MGIVESIAYSRDGRYVLTGTGDNTAKLWEASTGLQIRTFAGHTNKVTSVAFSANDLFVLTGSDDGTARIWDAATGLQLHAFPGGFSGMNAIAFSQDGRYVLTGKDENSERLWEAATGRELFSFEPAKLIMCAIFSPDGNYLVTAGRERVQFWEVATGTEIRSFQRERQMKESHNIDGKEAFTVVALAPCTKASDIVSSVLQIDRKISFQDTNVVVDFSACKFAISLPEQHYQEEAKQHHFGDPFNGMCVHTCNPPWTNPCAVDFSSTAIQLLRALLTAEPSGTQLLNHVVVGDGRRSCAGSSGNLSPGT